MEVHVAKYGDRIAVELPKDEELARAKVEALCATHGDSAVFIDGVSVVQLKAIAAEQAEKERLDDEAAQAAALAGASPSEATAIDGGGNA